MSMTEMVEKKVTNLEKYKKKLISAGIIFLVILIVVGSIWFAGWKSAKKSAEAKIDRLNLKIDELNLQIDEMNEEPFVVNPVTPQIIAETLHREVSGIEELATTEYLFTDAAEFSDSKQIKNWNIPFTEKSFILKWSGVIKAGVNLEEVVFEVDEGNKVIRVSAPMAEILSYDIDENSVEVLSEKDGLFNKVTIDDKVKFDVKTEDAMKKRAMEQGLLDQAQANAKDILLRLVQANSAICEEYTVEYSVIPQQAN